MHIWIFVATLPLQTVSGAHAANALARDTERRASAPTLGQAAMRRGIDELEMSKSAMLYSEGSRASARATQEELSAQTALEGAEIPYEEIKPLLPQVKAEVLEVRKYAFLASQHQAHAKQVGSSFSKIAEVAAEKAKEAIVGWMKADADETAEQSIVVDNKADKLAAAVAAAAEPYHLALLRNQKFCEQTYAKAKTANEAMGKLIRDAKKLALNAQQQQAAGQMESLEYMIVARGMMVQAEDLRKWANTLYSQANTACSTAGGYTMAETQAAANAAMTTAINTPMQLPAQGRK
jgi:ribosomal protein L17